MKFKSLAMRIWITFTTVILGIIFAISLVYFVGFRVADTNAKNSDLLVAHKLIKDNSFTQSPNFDYMRNLRDCQHFVYQNGSFILPFPQKKQQQNENFPSPQNNSSQMNKNAFSHIMQDDIQLKKQLVFLSEKADSDFFEKVNKIKHNGKTYIYAVSKTDSGYFISYMPLKYDNTLLYYMLITALIFILIGFLVANLIARSISKPLKELELFTKRVAAKNFNEPIEIGNVDEIGRLAHSMNKMQQELKRADKEERLFLQSISHDLKTPVMVIMSHADAIIDGMYVESLENTATIIKNESIALNEKIKHLLYFNTLDYVLENQTTSSEVDLGELVSNIAQRLRLVRDDVKWAFDIESAVIFANDEKLTVAIENIFDNALRYAKSIISVSLKKSSVGIILEIFNDGEQIKAENLQQIFDNMYKDKTGNFGLGLAITKKIINYYNGSICVSNIENGVVFRIEFKNGAE